MTRATRRMLNPNRMRPQGASDRVEQLADCSLCRLATSASTLIREALRTDTSRREHDKGSHDSPLPLRWVGGTACPFGGGPNCLACCLVLHDLRGPSGSTSLNMLGNFPYMLEWMIELTVIRQARFDAHLKLCARVMLWVCAQHVR